MGRCFRALISTLFLSSAESARISTEVDDEQVWNFDGIALNPDPRGPLIPDLVPPPDTTFQVVDKEMEFGLGSMSNNYRWALMTAHQGGNTTPVNEWFAHISGDGFVEDDSGLRRTVVANNLGQHLFIIEAARPSTTTSWRIRHPSTNAILFTINKDYVGAGFFGMMDEWRIYRGRERDADQIYYAVADKEARSHQFFHNEHEYQAVMTPAAQAKYFTQGGQYTEGFVPDSIVARVGPGEDTALILSTTIVIDVVNEVRAEKRREEDARMREEEAGHRRRRRSIPSISSDDTDSGST